MALNCAFASATLNAPMMPPNDYLDDHIVARRAMPLIDTLTLKNGMALRCDFQAVCAVGEWPVERHLGRRLNTFCLEYRTGYRV
jgi:hypothetical protein